VWAWARFRKERKQTLRHKFGKSPFDVPHYYRSLTFVLHLQNRIFEFPQVSNPVIFGHQLFWRVVFAWFFRNWVYKVPQLSKMFIFDPSTIKSIYFSSTVLERDIRMTWRWVNIPGACGGGTHDVTWLSSPLSHSSFPLPNTSFSLSPHPYPEWRSSLGSSSNDDELVRWRKTSETAAGSCDGACRAIRHDGLVW
jgi:hypothetical protein